MVFKGDVIMYKFIAKAVVYADFINATKPLIYKEHFEEWKEIVKERYLDNGKVGFAAREFYRLAVEFLNNKDKNKMIEEFKNLGYGKRTNTAVKALFSYFVNGGPEIIMAASSYQEINAQARAGMASIEQDHAVYELARLEREKSK